MVAHAIHAAGESAIPGPVPHGTYAVALAASDIDSVAVKLQELGVDHHPVIEDGELVAIGIAPLADRALVRKAVSSLPLIR